MVITKHQLVFLLLLIGINAKSQENQPSTIEPYAVNLENFDINNTSILPVDFSKIKVVGLGEATHGTSDFFKIKSAFIKNLILNHRFNTIIFEGSYANSDLLNNYIKYGQGNVYKAIIGLGPWCWYTEEVLELIEWLKNYNKSLSEDSKVQIYGCDFQNPKKAITNLADYLKSQLLNTQTLIDRLEIVSTFNNYRYLNKKEKTDVLDLLKELSMLSESILVKHPKINEHKRLIEQWHLYSENSDLRDQFLAENSLRILDQNQDNKVIIWAHNEHIANVKPLNQKIVPMGFYIKNSIGEDYYSVGFGFNAGDFNAVNNNQRSVINIASSKENSSDYMFSKFKYSSFFIDFRDLQLNLKADNWIDKPTLSKSIGQNYYPKGAYRKHILTSRFDGYIFVNSTKASSILDFNLLK